MARISRKKYNSLNSGFSEEQKMASGETITTVDFQAEEIRNEKTDKKSNNIIPFKKESDELERFEMKRSYSNQDDFNRIAFVSRALQKGVLPDMLRVRYKGLIHIEENDGKGSMVVGTNGQRLHYAEIGLALTPGEYKITVKKNDLVLSGPIKSEEEFGYPNWRAIVKEDITKFGTIDFHGTSISRDLLSTGLMSKRFYSLIKATEKIINLRYLDDLSKERWDVYLYSNKELNSPVVFRQALEKTIAAVIMPLTPEDE
jgi:hypothetical protein